MCGTANHKSERHGHRFRAPDVDAAAYEYLQAKETAATTTTAVPTTMTTALPPATPAAKRPEEASDSLSVVTAVTKAAVEKFTLFVGEVQKSPAYKWATNVLYDFTGVQVPRRANNEFYFEFM